MWSAGCSNLDDAIDAGWVKMIAFGKHWDSYFVLYDNGECAWFSAPQELDNFMKSRRRELPKVDFVSLGPKDQYFLRFADGSWRAKGLTDYERKLIAQTDATGSLREVSFGFGGGTIRYSPKPVY